MKRTFYMVRHGETLANKNGVAAGIFDTPLTDKGKMQARKLEEAVHASQLSFDYVVHSSLSRAADTAKIINRRLCLPMLENTDLTEQNFGAWQGRNWAETISLIKAGNPPPDGEPLDVFYERAMRGIKSAIQSMEGTPLLVSHGGVFDAFFSYYKLEEIDVENCAIYKLSIDESQDVAIGSAEPALSARICSSTNSP